MWQLSRGGGGTGSGIPAAAARFSAVEPDVIWYLVASQAQAQLILQGENDASRIRAAEGEPGREHEIEVVIVADEASLDGELLVFRHLSEIRSEAALETRLVDLRGRAD